MEGSGNFGRERRRDTRTTLQKILYVNLESGNGGIVVNISDGGLAFHSVAPVVDHGPVRIWFSLASDHRFEVSGEIIWSNQTKKTGGLRFTNLTDSDRAQIRSLAGELAILNVKPGVEPMPPQANREAGSPQTPLISAISTATPNPQIPTGYADRPQNVQQSALGALPAQTILQAEESSRQPLQPLPLAEDRTPAPDALKDGRANNPWAALPPESSSPSLGKVFLMLIGALVLVAGGVLAYSHSGQVGATMVRLGQRLEAGSHGASLSASPQVSQQAPLPEPVPLPQSVQEQPAAPAAPSSNVESSQPTDPAGDISTSKVPAAAATDAGTVTPSTRKSSSRAAAPATVEKALSDKEAIARSDDADSAADLDIAERYLNGVGHNRNSAAAAQFLWAAVAKGNATAELTLAHLYLNGDGVGRSCEQARVLLRAAADKGDLEATQSLANLDRQHCR